MLALALLDHVWYPISSRGEIRVASWFCPVGDPSQPSIARERHRFSARTITYDGFLKEIVQSTIIGSSWMHLIGTSKTLQWREGGMNAWSIRPLSSHITFSRASDEFRLDAERIEPVVCHWDDSIVPFSLTIVAVVLLLLWLHILEYEINLKRVEPTADFARSQGRRKRTAYWHFFIAIEKNTRNSGYH